MFRTVIVCTLATIIDTTVDSVWAVDVFSTETCTGLSWRQNRVWSVFIVIWSVFVALSPPFREVSLVPPATCCLSWVVRCRKRRHV